MVIIITISTQAFVLTKGTQLTELHLLSPLRSPRRSQEWVCIPAFGLRVYTEGDIDYMYTHAYKYLCMHVGTHVRMYLVICLFLFLFNMMVVFAFLLIFVSILIQATPMYLRVQDFIKASD